MVRSAYVGSPNDLIFGQQKHVLGWISCFYFLTDASSSLWSSEISTAPFATPTLSPIAAAISLLRVLQSWTVKRMSADEKLSVKSRLQTRSKNLPHGPSASPHSHAVLHITKMTGTPSLIVYPRTSLTPTLLPKSLLGVAENQKQKRMEPNL